MSTATIQASAAAVYNLIPSTWSAVSEILFSDRHEGHRLLLHLLDQVHSKRLTTLDIGIIERNFEEENDFCGKLENIALFSILAQRYGIEFGFEKQTSAFLTNADVFQLAKDLGITVKRADLPWALDVVAMDARMHGTFELPEEIFPLDLLFTIASRVKDWYEETVGHAIAYQGRHRMVLPDDVLEFMKETLVNAYQTYLEEKDAGVEKELAYDEVRRNLGVSTGAMV